MDQQDRFIRWRSATFPVEIPDTESPLRFFERDFGYSIYGNDAAFLVAAGAVSAAEIKHLAGLESNKPLPYATLSFKHMSDVLPQLLGYSGDGWARCVELWRPSSIGSFVRAAYASPGHFVQLTHLLNGAAHEVAATQNDTACVAAVCDGGWLEGQGACGDLSLTSRGSIGVAAVNSQLGTANLVAEVSFAAADSRGGVLCGGPAAENESDHEAESSRHLSWLRVVAGVCQQLNVIELLLPTPFSTDASTCGAAAAGPPSTRAQVSGSSVSNVILRAAGIDPAPCWAGLSRALTFRVDSGSSLARLAPALTLLHLVPLTSTWWRPLLPVQQRWEPDRAAPAHGSESGNLGGQVGLLPLTTPSALMCALQSHLVSSAALSAVLHYTSMYTSVLASLRAFPTFPRALASQVDKTGTLCEHNATATSPGLFLSSTGEDVAHSALLRRDAPAHHAKLTGFHGAHPHASASDSPLGVDASASLAGSGTSAKSAAAPHASNYPASSAREASAGASTLSSASASTVMPLRVFFLPIQASLVYDAAALYSLLVLPTPGGVRRDSGRAAGAGTPWSLFSYLNRCLSRSGARMLHSWLLTPLIDAAAIEARHNALQALLESPGLRPALRGCLRDALSGVTSGAAADLEHIAGRMSRAATVVKAVSSAAAGENPATGALVSMRDLYLVYKAALAMQAAADAIAPHCGAAVLASTATLPSEDDGAVVELGVEECDDDGRATSSLSGSSAASSSVSRVPAAGRSTPLLRIHSRLSHACAGMAQLRGLVEDTVDLNLLVASRGRRCHVTPSFSPQLEALASNRVAAEGRMNAAAEEARAALHFHGNVPVSKVLLEAADRGANAGWGTHLRVPPTQARALRAYMSAVIRDGCSRARPGGEDVVVQGPHEERGSSGVVGEDVCSVAAAPPAKRPRKGTHSDTAVGADTTSSAAAPPTYVPVFELGIRSDGYHFTTAQLRAASGDYEASCAAYAQLQCDYEAEIVDVACTHATVVAEMTQLLAELDVLLSFAEVVATSAAPFCRPVMIPLARDGVSRVADTSSSHPVGATMSRVPGERDATSGGSVSVVAPAWQDLSLTGLRHPLVEAALLAGRGVASFMGGVASTTFIPNDLHMRRPDEQATSRKHAVFHSPPTASGDAAPLSSSARTVCDAKGDPSERSAAVQTPYCGPHLAIITGPSMGGKSTFMRSVGLAVVLAQIGMYIPAASACMPVFTHLFSRSAAADDPMAGISTFTAEMVELSSLLHNVTPTSLVLLDEVGRGTSTREGFGIAAAVGEHLRDRVRCITLMATHFFALSSLADPPTLCRKSESSALEGDASSGLNWSEAAAPLASSDPPSVQRMGAGSQLPRPCLIPAPHQPAINLHAEAIVDAARGRLQLLYDMRPGASDKALGLEIAELCGLPGEVVAAARADLHSSNTKCKDAVPVDVDSAL